MAPTVSRRSPAPRRYPRAARLNELLREVVAEEIERLGDTDDRLALVTVTAVAVGPDLRSAVVFLSSLNESAAGALVEHRSRLQRAIGSQVRMKRTPRLEFEPDPGIASGQRVEEILREIHARQPDEGEEERGSRQ